jgi:plasmid segregation protein ParM
LSKVIGLDIGHSAVKVAHGNGTLMFPTAACVAFPLSDDAEARRADKETFAVGSTRYFIGETAQIQGGLTITQGLSADWIDSPEHCALVLAGVDKAVTAGAPRDALVVMGLPANTYSRQRAALKKVASELLGNEVLVVPQPYAPYAEMKLDAKGVPISSMMDAESWGVIEVGYFTTDFTLIQKDRPTERATSSCGGVRLAAENLQRMLAAKGIQANLVEAEESLRTHMIRNFKERIDITDLTRAAAEPLVTEVLDTANRLLEDYARRIDGIIVAGGGAGLIHDRLLERWPNLYRPRNPRFSVAEGMRRYGELQLIARSAAVAA